VGLFFVRVGACTLKVYNAFKSLSMSAASSKT